MKLREMVENYNLLEKQIIHELSLLRKQNIECVCFEDFEMVFITDEAFNGSTRAYQYCIRCGKKREEEK